MGAHSKFHETLCLKGSYSYEQLGADRSCGKERNDLSGHILEGPIEYSPEFYSFSPSLQIQLSLYDIVPF